LETGLEAREAKISIKFFFINVNLSLSDNTDRTSAVGNRVAGN